MTDNRPRQVTSHQTIKPPLPQLTIKQTQQSISNRNLYMDKIQRQIIYVDKANRELLSIADKIRGMNPLNSNSTNNLIIGKIENDIKLSLNQLIQNIMEFFKDIDNKLKNLETIVNNELSKKNVGPRHSNPSTQLQQTMDAKYEQLSEKIKSLEVSLKETQQNEKKLIQIIENMMQKYQVIDQPTLIRDTPALQNQFRKSRIGTVNSTSMKHLQQQSTINHNRIQMPSMTSNSNTLKLEKPNKSIYENLYTIQESVVNEGTIPQHFRLRQIEEDPCEKIFIKKLYSKTPPQTNQNTFLPDSRKLLRGQQMYQARSMAKPDRSTVSQATNLDDKQHRLNFMMDKLNL